jgi:hypothetical protein
LLVTPIEIGLMDTYIKSLKDLNYVLAQIKDGNFGEALKTIVGEGFDAGARLRVVERQLKMGTADLTQSMTPDEVKEFYGGFDQIKHPVEITVPGDRTKLPAAPDAAGDAAAKRIKDVTDALHQQLAVLGLTDREAEISNNLSRAKVEAASKEGKEIAHSPASFTTTSERSTQTTRR